METIYEKKRTYQKTQFYLSKGTAVEDREIHPYHEVLYYMDGDAVFLTENYRKTLRPGTLLLIPAGCYHYLKLSDPTKFERVKIKIPESVLLGTPAEKLMHKIRICEIGDGFIKELLKRIVKELQEESGVPDSDFLLSSAVWMLLAEGLNASEHVALEGRQEKQIQQIIRYIEENLAGDVSVSGIARSVHMSPSAVSHSFRQHMGVSIHKYVTEKRLSLARKRIEAHEKPSKIYLQCGYRDYSAFYKAYMKMYGYPPSGE